MGQDSDKSALYLNLNGECSEKYVRGVAFDTSFNRAITMQAVHYLDFSNNVGFNIMGHNVYLKDGYEIHNTIINNLMISAK